MYLNNVKKINNFEGIIDEIKKILNKTYLLNNVENILINKTGFLNKDFNLILEATTSLNINETNILLEKYHFRINSIKEIIPNFMLKILFPQLNEENKIFEYSKKDYFNIIKTINSKEDSFGFKNIFDLKGDNLYDFINGLFKQLEIDTFGKYLNLIEIDNEFLILGEFLFIKLYNSFGDKIIKVDEYGKTYANISHEEKLDFFELLTGNNDGSKLTFFQKEGVKYLIEDIFKNKNDFFEYKEQFIKLFKSHPYLLNTYNIPLLKFIQTIDFTSWGRNSIFSTMNKYIVGEYIKDWSKYEEDNEYLTFIKLFSNQIKKRFDKFDLFDNGLDFLGDIINTNEIQKSGGKNNFIYDSLIENLLKNFFLIKSNNIENLNLEIEKRKIDTYNKNFIKYILSLIEVNQINYKFDDYNTLINNEKNIFEYEKNINNVSFASYINENIENIIKELNNIHDFSNEKKLYLLNHILYQCGSHLNEKILYNKLLTTTYNKLYNLFTMNNYINIENIYFKYNVNFNRLELNLNGSIPLKNNKNTTLQNYKDSLIIKIKEQGIYIVSKLKFNDIKKFDNFNSLEKIGKNFNKLSENNKYYIYNKDFKLILELNIDDVKNGINIQKENILFDEIYKIGSPLLRVYTINKKLNDNVFNQLYDLDGNLISI